MSDLLEGMNEQQLAAVTAPEGPVLVLAGPGSGKTRVLTHRIAFLVKEIGVPAYNIVAVTFTNKAAAEMRGRVEKLLNPYDEKARITGLRIGTFHAICAQLLRREHERIPYGQDYVIFDTDDQLSVVTQALREMDADTKRFTPRGVLSAISKAKNELITARDFHPLDYYGEIVARVYPRYQDILLDNNAMDFDDLLMNMVLLMRDDAEARDKYQRLFQFVLVDEFQDTNFAQYQLVKLLGAPQNNIFAVGDEDQAIYAFRGADYRNVMQFREDFSNARVILLEQNYRSPQAVLDVARAVIDRNPHRTPKALFTTREDKIKISVQEAYSEADEGAFIIDTIESLRKRQGYAYRDFAVMYRTNAQSRAIEDTCVKRGVPYKLVGGVGFYKRIEVRDLLAYLRLINNPNDTVSFARIINTPKRGIGKRSVEDFQQWAARDGLTYGAAMRKLLDGESTPLANKAAGQFAAFGRQLETWRVTAAKGDLVELFDELVRDLGYTLYLQEISDTIEQVREREDNVDELRNILSERREGALGDFLMEIALVADVDTLKDDVDAITLMTLHAAKGLEFPVVFITGVEDGFLPHQRAYDEPDGLAEERRLMYVGITRAKERLYLTYAFRRTTRGYGEARTPSAFLADIPPELTEGLPSALGGGFAAKRYERQTQWENPFDKWLRDYEQKEQRRSSEARPSDTPQADSPPNAAHWQSQIRPLSGSTPPPKPLTYRPGLRVMHTRFGEGVVVDSRRVADDEEITIRFSNPRHGTKILMSSYGNLLILGE